MAGKTWRQHHADCAREYFAALLLKHGGRITAVAAESGLHRADVYKKLQQLGLWKPSKRRAFGNDEWRALSA